MWNIEECVEERDKGMFVQIGLKDKPKRYLTFYVEIILDCRRNIVYVKGWFRFVIENIV